MVITYYPLQGILRSINNGLIIAWIKTGNQFVTKTGKKPIIKPVIND